MLVNTAGFCTDEVSNHTIMLLLACAKDLASLNELVKSGKWAPRHSGALHLSLTAIDGQTLGLVGCGNIARATARKAKVFGLETIAYDPYVEPWIARDYGIKLVAGLDELARRSDFVSMHVPLNNETRRLVGEGFFKAMKPTAYFINTCRGPTVDERALIRALESGELAGAGLDVFEEEPTSPDNPLLKMDNVIATPHSAGSSVEAYRDAEIQMGQEAARIVRGMWPFALVNPEVRGVIPQRHAALNA
jgi:D-3-phosphoglycerate dehydrogenase